MKIYSYKALGSKTSLVYKCFYNIIINVQFLSKDQNSFVSGVKLQTLDDRNECIKSRVVNMILMHSSILILYLKYLLNLSFLSNTFSKSCCVIVEAILNNRKNVYKYLLILLYSVLTMWPVNLYFVKLLFLDINKVLWFKCIYNSMSLTPCL